MARNIPNSDSTRERMYGVVIESPLPSLLVRLQSADIRQLWRIRYRSLVITKLLPIGNRDSLAGKLTARIAPGGIQILRGK